MADRSRATWSGGEEPIVDAGRLAGLLADQDRLAVVAALVLGANEVAEIGQVTGLGTRQVVTALGRLVDAQLVERGSEGRYELLTAAIREAARAARPAADEDRHGDQPASSARVLRAFVREGRLTSIPMQRAKRLVVLDVVAQEFEPGERYGEAAVNLKLLRWHPDTAALRRYLVDEGFLMRRGGEYWRSGGSVPVD